MSTFELDDTSAPNLFFATRFAQIKVQRELAGKLEGISTAVSNVRPDGQIAPAVQVLGDKLDTLNQTIGKFDRDESDDVVALYAVAFGAHGGASEYSQAGCWIREAWRLAKLKGEPGVCTIAKLPRTQFNALATQLKLTRSGHGALVEKLSDDDFDRFLGLAPGVCKSLDEQSLALPTSGAPTP